MGKAPLLALFSLIGILGGQSMENSLQTVKQGVRPSKTEPTAASKIPVQAASDPNATEANLKIAFIGDVGTGPYPRAVLNLIKSEGAQAVLHQGDFDYHNDPVSFWSSVDDVLGHNFPYFISV